MEETCKSGVVIGASTGIGHACANYLSDAGHRILGVARTVPANARFESVQLDVTSLEAEQEIKEILRKEDFDYVIFCVGQLLIDDLESADLEVTRQLIDVNCLSLLSILRSFYGLDSQKKRSVVLVSSIHAGGCYDRFSYAISKAALEAIMDNCVARFASKSIAINCIRPGPVQTDKFKKTHPEGSATYRAFLEAIPLKRLGRPEELAKTVELLVSDAGRCMTGQRITISGGL